MQYKMITKADGLMDNLSVADLGKPIDLFDHLVTVSNKLVPSLVVRPKRARERSPRKKNTNV